jgi:DNA repair protein RecN (Recombination protein N)
VLSQLRITGLGVIDDAVLQLHPGLTVLTGETGAGKTMVVQGLGLLLGARADPALVREGCPAASVEGIVVLPQQHPARARALEAGGQLDADELVLARTVGAEGRSRAHVGGRTAPVGVLGELGEMLVVVHGQADQWRLRRADQHRDAVDDHGGAAVGRARAAYQQAYAAWRAALAERDRLTALDRDRTRELDVLTAGLEHIERVAPQPGEDLALRGEDERLTHADGLRQAAQAAHAALCGGEEGQAHADVPAALELLSRAGDALGHEARHDAQLALLQARVAEAGYLVADLVADLASYLADLELDPARLGWVGQRRAELAALTRRYGASIDEVLDWARASAARVAELLGADERLAQLEVEVDQAYDRVLTHAAALSTARRAAGERFASAVSAELRHLAMGSARVLVAVTPRELGPSGADDVEIQLAANSGAPPRSVSRAASGGELSRLMLAIEVVGAGSASAGSAGELPVPTFVFDEVDAGVGGRAALDVGARLAQLATRAQVVVVTHLAQVAAYADRHLVVRKSDDGSVTASAVTEVTDAARLQELARMMGGGSTDAALAHARELLAQADGDPARGDAPGPRRTRRAPARA